MSALPRCVVLRSKHDGSYLHSVHDESHGGSLIELGSPDGGIMNPRVRFYLEPSSKQEDEGHMHVRCCYNNKYWVPQQHGGSDRLVIGTTDQPEEDLSKPECTLFKHIPIAGDGEQAEENGSTTCRLLHSKLGKYAYVPSTPFTPTRSYLHITSHEDEADRQDGGGLIDAFTVLDVSNQKQLPSYLAFKGDNRCFLVAENSGCLAFSGGDIADSRALHTIFTNDDGVVRIKSNYTGFFWTYATPSMMPGIFATSDDTTNNNPSTLFRVTTGDDFIALQNLGNNKFCCRSIFINVFGGNLLCPLADSIITEARLQYNEPVLSRDVYNVDFRLNEARMHTKGIDDLYSQTVKNQTSTTNKTTLTFMYTSTVETTWSSTVSVKLGVKTTLECGIPFIAEGKIEISAEFSGSYTWGETKTEQKQTSKDITVDVPPMKKVTVKAIGSNGVCDIPFSYKQRDVLTNGQEVIKEFTDGMYFGVKTSNITFETIEEDL